MFTKILTLEERFWRDGIIDIIVVVLCISTELIILNLKMDFLTCKSKKEHRFWVELQSFVAPVNR